MARSAVSSTPHSAYALVEPDAATWDRFVIGHPDGHALQSAAWGELKRFAGWRPRLLAVAGSGAIVAGALVLTRSKFGIAMAYTPRGPLFGDTTANEVLLAGLKRVASAARAVVLRLEPNVLAGSPGADELHSQLLLHGYRIAAPIQPASSIHLELAPAPERLLASMSKGHRADIRRAAREGVLVSWGSSKSELEQFYAILVDTARRAEFGIHSCEYYATVLRLFGDAARVWIASRNGVAEAAALTLAWGKQALYLYSGSTEAGLRSGAQHAIQWEVIQWARERGCRTYDFWGI
ncbi:MAG TPA: peptidoglycan bridge formation glycyltransferase FemA/FemB family protein, partial [Roseiflexaceae bacterium]|nr:peptidoglycan bridge formation glycyltransferase FemA/FemB family protein [Roseiflexaceae bacterium]